MSTTSINYSYFINAKSHRRRPALTREITKRQYNSPKEQISLAEGVPNEITFPFESITIKLKDGSKFDIVGQELASALQYIPTQGYPPLVKSVKEFTNSVHSPPGWDRYETLITNGSQDGMSRVLEMILEENDSMLVQNPYYAGVEAIIKPLNINVVGVDEDEFGIVPQKLIDALENCKKYTEEGGGRMPKVIYLNPTASNPSGRTIPLERKKEIYEICCKYNIIILEDDAYYFLHFLDQQPISFLSLDTEGRVIRLDSMSKVLSSGLRLGWVTGPKRLIQNIEIHISSCILHSSVLSQVILENLFKKWGASGLISYFSKVASFYRARRDFTMACMEKHLKGLCEWEVPSGGMFVWFKIIGVSDVYEMLLTRGLKKHITFIPGQNYMADPTAACNYVRASYSKASLKQIDKAMQTLAELIREEHLLLRRKLDSLDDEIIIR
ncbi:kynurenine/alpha-aminoadipate aminotransferase, mitochondrial-like [Diorhabda carinulata]|uniref:kynurenine/alpha-aminoadipate aminotransferase, mitochondrial-like n=1 Tax=Diorhabda carinulata TaxID=1163345 RepID=UPI0025A1D808|nr:kynurenine/alpha-aminoadipate aminotransferase, mitochondrial-like [Diorhabda carinulata]